MKKEKKADSNLALIAYISHLVRVREMLKKANFPYITPDEEKVLQNVAIDCCLEFEISIEDLICVMPELKPANINKGLNNLSRKGYIYFEEDQQTTVSRKMIKLTELAQHYLDEMSQCIINLNTYDKD